MSEHPPKSSNQDIVFVSPEEESPVSEQAAESLGETWTPKAVTTCKVLFDEIEAFTQPSGGSWQPELNVALSNIYQAPLADLDRVKTNDALEQGLFTRFERTLGCFFSDDTVKSLRAWDEGSTRMVLSPVEFHKILQRTLELLSEKNNS